MRNIARRKREGVAENRKSRVTLCSRIGVMLALLSALLGNVNSFAISLGDRVETNATVNVRSTPAGTVSGQQTLGVLGIVVGGPTTASLNGTQYTWWDINFDSGVDGWVADIGLNALAPAAPIQSSPGNASSPGPTISTLTPTMSWNLTAGAVNYGVYIYDVTTSTLVYNNDYIGNFTSLNLPSGYLVIGHNYRWNMRASDSAGFSGYSGLFLLSGAGWRAGRANVEFAGQRLKSGH